MTLGQRISLYRKKLNISQEELGARLGVSRQAVSKWETDLSAPDLNNLIGLARELGVSLAELTETPEEPVPPKNTSKKWWFLLSVCVLLPVLIPMQMGKTEPQEIKLTEDQDNEAFLDDFAVEDDMEL